MFKQRLANHIRPIGNSCIAWVQFLEVMPVGERNYFGDASETSEKPLYIRHILLSAFFSSPKQTLIKIVQNGCTVVII